MDKQNRVCICVYVKWNIIQPVKRKEVPREAKITGTERWSPGGQEERGMGAVV